MTHTAALEPINLFVYILESPAEADLYYKRNEGEALQRALELLGVTSVHRLIVSRGMLQDALDLGVSEALSGKPAGLPIVHLSAHGSAEGIRLTNRDFVSWAELHAFLLPAKARLGELLLCMSACEGFAAYRTAMTAGALPFDIVVGSTGKPTWADTTVAFSSFYHLLAKGCEIDIALSGMRAASGHAEFSGAAAVSVQEVFMRRRAEKRAALEGKVP